MLVRFLLLLLLSRPATAAADAALDGVVAIAVRDNPELAGARIDTAITRTQIRQADGLEDFHLDFNAAWSTTRVPYVSGNPLVEVADDDAHSSLSLSRALPWGGRVALTGAFDYTRARYISDDGSGPASSTLTAYTPSLILSLTQPLLRGLGLSIARAPRLRAREQHDAAKLTAVASATSVVRDLVVGYWEYAFALSERAIREQSLELAKRQLEIVEANIEVGKLEPSASAEVEVAIALREDELRLAEAAVESRLAEVARLVGDPLRHDIAEPASRAPGCDVELAPEVVAQVSAANPTLAALRAMLPAVRIDEHVAENGVLPKLDVSAAAGPSGAASSAETSFSQLGTFASYQATAGLLLSTALERRTALGLRDEMRLRVERLEARIRTLEGHALADLRSRRAALEAAKQRASTLTRSLGTARLDLEAERARFALGRSTSFEVLRRQASLAETQLRSVRAQIDCQQAYTDILALSGTLLQTHGVIFDGGT